MRRTFSSLLFMLLQSERAYRVAISGRLASCVNCEISTPSPDKLASRRLYKWLRFGTREKSGTVAAVLVNLNNSIACSDANLLLSNELPNGCPDRFS